MQILILVNFSTFFLIYEKRSDKKKHNVTTVAIKKWRYNHDKINIKIVITTDVNKYQIN